MEGPFPGTMTGKRAKDLRMRLFSVQGYPPFRALGFYLKRRNEPLKGLRDSVQGFQGQGF